MRLCQSSHSLARIFRYFYSYWNQRLQYCGIGYQSCIFTIKKASPALPCFHETPYLPKRALMDPLQSGGADILSIELFRDFQFCVVPNYFMLCNCFRSTFQGLDHLRKQAGFGVAFRHFPESALPSCAHFVLCLQNPFYHGSYISMPCGIGCVAESISAGRPR